MLAFASIMFALPKTLKENQLHNFFFCFYFHTRNELRLSNKKQTLIEEEFDFLEIFCFYFLVGGTSEIDHHSSPVFELLQIQPSYIFRIDEPALIILF